MLYSREHTTIPASQYYWEYVKRFGKESAETFKRDFLVSGGIAFATWAIGYSDHSVVDAVILGLKASGIIFAIIALGHLAHVSLILHRERYHPENGGIERVPAWFGVWGVALLLIIIVGSGYTTYALLLRHTDRVVISLPAPTAPSVVAPSVPEARSLPVRPAQRDAKLRAAAPNSTSPRVQTQAASSVTPTTPPATFLDRVVQKNHGLTQADRNRLSDLLYSADKFLKECQALGYNLNLEFGAVTRDRQSGELAKNVDDHVKVFGALKATGWDDYHALQKFQTDNEYFSDQTEYIFGDNPFNAGIGLALNSASAMDSQLSAWSKIENRTQPDVLNLVGSFQSEPQTQLNTFFKWVNESLQRINQMRQSLDPNGVVQPFPSNAPAPAPAMFLFSLPPQPCPEPSEFSQG